MTEAPHLTNQQFAGFQARTLAPAELLAVDQHLADCVECRDRLAREIHAPEQLAGLRELLSEHLEYHQLVAAAQGTPDSASDAHLAVCPMCRDEVEDLRQFQSSLKTRPRVVEMPVRRPAWRIPAYAAIAAGLLLAAGLAIRGRRQEPPAPEQPIAQTAPAPTQPAEPALAPEQQAAVQLALSTHRLERAGVLDTLITKPSVLLGAAPQQKSFEVKAPVGTTVLTDRPLFSWREVPGASKYQVAVFDDRFQKVAESPALKVAEWTPRVPLTRGHVYSWQVTAYMDRPDIAFPRAARSRSSL